VDRSYKDDLIWHKDTKTEEDRIPAKYLLVDAWKKDWATGESHTLKIKITPSKVGTYHVYVRCNMVNDSGDVFNYPPSGLKDQQGWYVYVLTFEVVEENEPPIPNAGGPYSGKVGKAIQFDGSKSHDPDGTIVEWKWDFGDGTTGSGENPTHIYNKAGEYTVLLEVKDNKEEWSETCAVATVTVSEEENEPPIPNAGGPYSGKVGKAIQFDGSGSYDPDGTIVEWEWDFGDGTTGSGEKPIHTYNEAKVYSVTLRVKDDKGAWSEKDETTVTVTKDGPKTRDVKIIVQDEFGNPLSGIKIWTPFKNTASFSNEDGVCFFHNVPLGTYEIRAENNIGYKEKTIQITVVAGEGHQEFILTVKKTISIIEVDLSLNYDPYTDILKIVANATKDSAGKLTPQNTNVAAYSIDPNEFTDIGVPPSNAKTLEWKGDHWEKTVDVSEIDKEGPHNVKVYFKDNDNNLGIKEDSFFIRRHFNMGNYYLGDDFILTDSYDSREIYDFYVIANKNNEKIEKQIHDIITSTLGGINIKEGKFNFKLNDIAKVGILANFGLIILEEIETKTYYDKALKTVVTPVFEVRDVNGNIIKKYNSWVEYNIDYQEGREEQTMIAGTEAKYLGTFARMEFCYYKDHFVPVFVNVNPAFFLKEAEHKGEITSFVENESEAYISQANSYFTQGDYESAKSYYEKAKEAYEEEGNAEKVSECEEKISECEEKLKTVNQEDKTSRKEQITETKEESTTKTKTQENQTSEKEQNTMDSEKQSTTEVQETQISKEKETSEHKPIETQPSVKLTPISSEIFNEKIDDNFSVRVQIEGDSDEISEVRYRIGNVEGCLKKVSGNIFSAEIPVDPLENGTQILEITAYDKTGCEIGSFSREVIVDYKIPYMNISPQKFYYILAIAIGFLILLGIILVLKRMPISAVLLPVIGIIIACISFIVLFFKFDIDKAFNILFLLSALGLGSISSSFLIKSISMESGFEKSIFNLKREIESLIEEVKKLYTKTEDFNGVTSRIRKKLRDIEEELLKSKKY
ncbi:MAG: PKD domain-containing protein, partial [Candidatus Heimdallarchaeaceae archaeon]